MTGNRAAVQPRSAHTSIVLPVPPSVNAAYRNVGGLGRVKSGAYLDWLKEADDAYLQQKRHVRPLTGPFRLTIYLPSKLRGDISNRIKVVEDYLVSREITPDDSLCQKVSAERFNVEEGICVVEVEAA